MSMVIATIGFCSSSPGRQSRLTLVVSCFWNCEISVFEATRADLILCSYLQWTSNCLTH